MLAPKLLGLKLCSRGCEGVISEVEAYEGENDPASHAFKRTKRSELMLSTYSHLYVYFIYGKNYCLNITCGENRAGAILIRSVIPTKGIELMRQKRSLHKKTGLEGISDGPGKLCQAFGVDKSYNGTKLGEKLWIEKESEVKLKDKFKVVASTRIGISKGEKRKWRFQLKEI